VNTFPYFGCLITEDGECTAEFRSRLNRGHAIGASLQKNGKVTAYGLNEDKTIMKALAWPVATYGCESWILRKNEETRLEAFEMK